MMPCARLMLVIATLTLVSTSVAAHDGPPFPIVSDQIVGRYKISVWTDPDTTDDGTPRGQFWVTLEMADGAATVPAGTIASVSIRPLDRDGASRAGQAAPVSGDAARQFVALVMDHEGPFGVRVAIDGPQGAAQVDAQVTATYDLRPSRGLLLVYLLPFVLVGALWAKVLVHRRRGARRQST